MELATVRAMARECLPPEINGVNLNLLYKVEMTLQDSLMYLSTSGIDKLMQLQRGLNSQYVMLETFRFQLEYKHLESLNRDMSQAKYMLRYKIMRMHDLLNQALEPLDLYYYYNPAECGYKLGHLKYQMACTFCGSTYNVDADNKFMCACTSCGASTNQYPSGKIHMEFYPFDTAMM